MNVEEIAMKKLALLLLPRTAWEQTIVQNVEVCGLTGDS
jgi:hypothetical protein